jgi:general secretion pathway protein E
MLEMGVEPYQITSSVSAVLNQRLVRMLCDDCKTPDKKTGTCKPVGCDNCLNTGYKGRRLIAEIVQIDGELRKAILAKTDLDELDNILTSRGHMTMAHDAQRLITEGITTRQEITRVLGPTNE